MLVIKIFDQDRLLIEQRPYILNKEILQSCGYEAYRLGQVLYFLDYHYNVSRELGIIFNPVAVWFGRNYDFIDPD